MQLHITFLTSSPKLYFYEIGFHIQFLFLFFQILKTFLILFWVVFFLCFCFFHFNPIEGCCFQHYAEKIPHRELIAYVFDCGSNVLARCSPKWESKVNNVALFLATIHDLIILYHSQQVLLWTTLGLFDCSLPCHWRRQWFWLTLNFLLHELQLDTTDFVLVFGWKFFHFDVATYDISVDA